MRHPYNVCLFRAPALLMHGNEQLEGKTSKLFNLFIDKMDGLSADQFNGVQTNDIATVEDLLTLNILLYDTDFLDGNIVGELARRSVQNYENTVRLLRCNNHICYVNNIIAVFQSFRCTNWDTFSNKTFNLERRLTTCSERVKNVYPSIVYQIRETHLTSWTLSVSSTRMNKNSSKIYQYSTLNQFVSKRKPSETQIQQLGLGNMSRYLYQIFQTLWKNQFISASLILIPSLNFFWSS